MGKNENSNPVGRGQDEDVEDQDEEQKTKVSLACTPRNGAVSNGSLVLRAEEEMCAWAFDILIAHLEGHPKRPPPPVSVVRLKECGVSCPAFVTWMKQRKGAVGFSREDADLRGCIGSLSPIPIMELGEYVLTSALRDRRFKPISLREVPRLKCHVSLLHSYEQASHALDWTVGLHGTTISFCDDRGVKYSATYLPEIAKEMQMTQREAIASLVKKAGYTGAVTDELLDRISLTLYQSSQARLDFDSYVANCERDTLLSSGVSRRARRPLRTCVSMSAEDAS